MIKTTEITDKVSVADPLPISNPLQALLSLQSLFNTDNVTGYESWKRKLTDHNILCISTKGGKYELRVLNGYVLFYDAKKELMEVNLSGNHIAECMTNFVDGLRKAKHCEVRTKEYESGNTNFKEFRFWLRMKNGNIERHSSYAERHESEGADGDL